MNDGPGVGITRVIPDQVVATLSAGVAGRDGRDVFGNALVHKPAATTFQLGEGLVLQKGEVVTTAKGNLVFRNGTLRVHPMLEVYRDDGKPVEFEGDVLIKGGLRDGQIVHASGSVVVGGAVEAAKLNAGGSLHVKGGMIGKNTGRCDVAGDIYCRFISAMHVAAHGSVNVQGEIVHSTIHCGGALTATMGTIYDSKVIASGGVVCQTLGNERGVPTLIEAGTDRTELALVLSEAREIEASQKRVHEIRQKIEPLMKFLKSLTPQQRERVTELMAEAGTLEEESTRKAQDAEQRCQAMRQHAKAEIVVREAAYPGVTVRFPGVETTFRAAIKGPFKLVSRKQSLLTEILLIDEADGSSTVLPSHQVLEAGLASAERITYRNDSKLCAV
jgi:uncharacterized protein (DUF342 family)